MSDRKSRGYEVRRFEDSEANTWVRKMIRRIETGADSFVDYYEDILTPEMFREELLKIAPFEKKEYDAFVKLVNDLWKKRFISAEDKELFMEALNERLH